MNPEDTSGLSRRQVAVGAAWTVPSVMIAGAVPAAAASPTRCAPVSGSYGAAPLTRTDQNSGARPFLESANQATTTVTQIYADNRGTVSNANILQYTRAIPLQLEAGCCYVFSSSVYASAANPYNSRSGGISGLIYFEGSSPVGYSTRGATYADWPGLTQLNVGTNPLSGVTRTFEFQFCATETRVHTYFQFFRVRPSGTTSVNNPGSDDMRFNELTVLPA